MTTPNILATNQRIDETNNIDDISIQVNEDHGNEKLMYQNFNKNVQSMDQLHKGQPIIITDATE